MEGPLSEQTQKRKCLYSKLDGFGMNLHLASVLLAIF